MARDLRAVLCCVGMWSTKKTDHNFIDHFPTLFADVTVVEGVGLSGREVAGEDT